MSLCVPPEVEQDKHVVDTFDLKVRKLDLRMLLEKDGDGAPKYSTFWIGGSLLKIHAEMFEQEGSCITTVSSVLEIPKHLRARSILICFGEDSYAGRQSLYHTFGTKFTSSFQQFEEVFGRLTTEEGDAIVFTPEGLFWTEADYFMRPRLSQSVIDTVLEKRTRLCVGGSGHVIWVDDISGELSTLLEIRMPTARYINFKPATIPECHPLKNGGRLWSLWGWKELPQMKHTSYMEFVVVPSAAAPAPAPAPAPALAPAPAPAQDQENLAVRIRKLDLGMLTKPGQDGELKYPIYWVSRSAIISLSKIFKEAHSPIQTVSSVLDIPEDLCAKSILIVCDEPSYSGRQLLYTMYGDKFDKPYDNYGTKVASSFQQFEKVFLGITSEKGNAIVFSPMGVYWTEWNSILCPSVPMSSIVLARMKMVPCEDSGHNVIPVESLAGSLGPIVKLRMPRAKYIHCGDTKITENHKQLWYMSGWDNCPVDTNHGHEDYGINILVSMTGPNTQFIDLQPDSNVDVPAPPAAATAPAPAPAPSIQDQLTALTEAMKALTAAVERRLA